MKTLLICASLLLLTGCMSFTDRPLRPVRDALAQQLPDIRLQKEVGIAMSGGMFDFLDMVTPNEADLSEIDHVQVAVYSIHPRGGFIDFTDEIFHESLMAKDAGLTWDRIVKVKEDSEQVWVYVGMDLDSNSLEALSVFVLENDELVLINLGGDFYHMLEFAMKPARGHRGIYSSH
ncbi:MAG: DUF4252 domain-containing protein [Gammaproteobacteria bacterium]|nr:DUF4252 domain-containing protein [Gammaproteobacteria bacterium]